MMVKQRINMWNLLFKEKDWITCTHSLCCYTFAKEVGGGREGGGEVTTVIRHTT